MDKKHILSEIKRTAKANGDIALGRSRFLQETGIRESDWKGKYWVNWSDAVAEAGVSMSSFVQPIDEEVLLSKAATFIRELGHFPQRAELRLKRKSDKSFPTDSVFFTRFGGTKDSFASAVIDWCSIQSDWEDVIVLCEPAAIPRNQTKEAPSEEPNGFVYLMKSGKYYKIGRTNSLDRRQYEIGMQLPEGISPIHSIETDDPSGIEAYWHNRFSDKRMNGEWFNLSGKDIAVFRKRKFM